MRVWGLNLGLDDVGQAEVVREFERRNPNIKIEVLGMGLGGMNPQKLMTSLLAGDPPDVVYQDRFSVADWASRGAFESLESLVARDRPDPAAPRREDYVPAAWDEASWDGELYGVPIQCDTRALYWNRSRFREAGLPDRPPATWDETLAVSRLLTGKGRYGFLPLVGNSYFALFALQKQAPVLDGERCVLQNERSRAALEFMGEAYGLAGGYEASRTLSVTSGASPADAFSRGQVAMKIDGDWSLRRLLLAAPDLDFGVAPPPMPADAKSGQARTWVGGFAYCIPRGARHREAAWDYIKFATSTEGRGIERRAQMASDAARGLPTYPRPSAHIPSNREALAEFNPKDARTASAVQTHFQLLAVAASRPRSAIGQTIWQEQNRATEAFLAGKRNATEALADAQAQIQGALDERARLARAPRADLRAPVVLGSTAVALAALTACGLGWRRLGPLGRWEARWGLLLVAPWLVGAILFTIGPLVASLVLSTTLWNGVEPPRWIGLANYRELFGPDRERTAHAFGNVAYLVGVGVPLSVFASLGLALVMDWASRFGGAVRWVVGLPSILPAVATTILWLWLFHPDPAIGAVNATWTAVFGKSLPPPGWFASAEWAKPALVALGLWGAGSGALVFLAGLRRVPRDLQDAAEIDGAGPGARFRAVTLPHLAPILAFTAVAGVIGALQTFDTAYVATGAGAGPGDSLLFPVYQVFVSGFAELRLGYASALAWVVFVVAALATLAQFAIARLWSGDRGGA
ncbi:MAG: extracellular solute-binding protein [Fimbriimonadaceae bacterium]|nr:extracellular solute-binding protein [Fimbriimonadaceae bacterium]QYK56818.1 MAG: extracellular solute-binding protein [Fimbriimonadaceae bacterium]